MKKTSFAGNTLSQYNPEIVLKEASDFYGQALRTIDSRSVTGYYSHFRAEYNTDNNPTKVSYYRGTKAYTTVVTFLPAATLNNKYFILHSAPDNQLYAIWYNVDGTGSAPVVANSKLIQINVSASDSAEFVAAATKITLENLYSDVFTAGTRNGANLYIYTTGLGEVDGSFDFNTGFTVIGTQGQQELVEELLISYTGTDPIFEGQLLKGYEFDIYSGKFNKNPEVQVEVGNVGIEGNGNELNVNSDGSINVNVVSTGQILRSYFSEVAGVVTGVTEQICTYTPSAPVYLQKIEVSGTNISTYELFIGGVKQDKKITYFSGSLDTVFNFDQGLNVAAGDEIEVRVYHNRPDTGTYSARMQILESGA